MLVIPFLFTNDDDNLDDRDDNVDDGDDGDDTNDTDDDDDDGILLKIYPCLFILLIGLHGVIRTVSPISHISLSS